VGRFQRFTKGAVYWSPYSGAQEIHGAIHRHWAALGWERSPLGYPTTDETSTPDQTGRFNHFQYGSIYWTPTTGAWEVHGPILEAYEAVKGPRSRLGYPKSDVVPTPAGARSVFQGGMIVWSAATGRTSIVYG
jgi:uncharacterized protein with LGFP repeats